MLVILTDNPKSSLRRVLLEKRDHTSYDLLNIAAEKISDKLETITAYKNANNIGVYYAIGSEIPTSNIINKLQSLGKSVSLPKICKKDLEFKKISDLSSLEMNSFGIMEPKDRCPTINSLDVILVPAIGMTRNGSRLGYGCGFYDRYLEKNNTDTIALVLEKQIIKNIPQTEYDQKINWIVTEDKIYNTLHG